MRKWLNLTWEFTAIERDREIGLDYFGARYYGSALGRISSADLEVRLADARGERRTKAGDTDANQAIGTPKDKTLHSRRALAMEVSELLELLANV